MSVRPAAPADAPDITRVHLQSWREAYQDLLPPAYLARMTGELVGFVTGGAARNIPACGGELYALYLLQSAQGHGLGRALVRELARAMRAGGSADLMLWVLAGNPTRGFYTHLGGQPVGEKTETVPEGELREVAYGWPDIGALC